MLWYPNSPKLTSTPMTVPLYLRNSRTWSYLCRLQNLDPDPFAVELRTGQEEVVRQFHVRNVRFVEFEVEVAEYGGQGHVEFGVGETVFHIRDKIS